MNIKNTWVYRFIRPYMWWKPPLLNRAQSVVFEEIIADMKKLKRNGENKLCCSGLTKKIRGKFLVFSGVKPTI